MQHPIISITHDFVWDSWFHLQQVPLRDQHGDPITEIKDPGPKHPVAKEVYWRQPFPDKYDFTGISAAFIARVNPDGSFSSANPPTHIGRSL